MQMDPADIKKQSSSGVSQSQKSKRLSINPDSPNSKKRCGHHEDDPKKLLRRILEIFGLEKIKDDPRGKLEAAWSIKGPQQKTLTKLHKYLTGEDFVPFRSIYQRMPTSTRNAKAKPMFTDVS